MPTVWTFDVRVRIGFARLDVVNRRLMFGAPVDEGPGGKFGTVVDPEGGRAAVDGDELVEDTNHAPTGQRRSDRDFPTFPIAFIDQCQQAHASAVVERLGRRGTRRVVRRGRFRRSAQDTRCTCLWFHRRPSVRMWSNSFQKPHRA